MPTPKMNVSVTKKDRYYTYDLYDDNGNIIEHRVSLERYTLCTNNGRKFYTHISKVKEKDLPKLVTIHHETTNPTNQ